MADVPQPAPHGGHRQPSHDDHPPIRHDDRPSTPRGDQRQSRHGDHPSPVGGLSVAANGLRLVAPETHLEPGVETTWTFEVRDASGAVVTAYEETHDAPSHLVVVRRDLTGFQHRHPTLGPDGVWSAELSLPRPGVYRAFVDVLVGGVPTTLGTDLFVSGAATYESGSAPAAGAGPAIGADASDAGRDAVVDGYSVSIAPRTVPADAPTDLEFRLRRGGATPHLEPYLGALGHLVVLRAGDLAYVHVHPEPTDPADGVVRFRARFPAAGRHRAFLQARPAGELVTAAFDLDVVDEER